MTGRQADSAEKKTLFMPEALEGGEACAQVARLVPPKRPAFPVVFSSPHSGRCYPVSFVEQTCLTLQELRLSEDYLVDRLFSAAPEKGFWLYAAQRPRSWLDLNRDARELDPAMFEGELALGPLMDSERVRSGLGVIPEVVSEGRRIYAGRIPAAEAKRRLEEGYFPWHLGLKNLLESLRRQHGQAVLIDCHSMPATAVRAMTPLGSRPPDIILGDCEGTSCARLLTDVLEALFSEAGLNVSRNRVYSGGFITRHYGLGGLGFQAIQIEISRTLYMKEGRCETTEGFATLKTIIDAVLAALPERLAPLWSIRREAAE